MKYSKNPELPYALGGAIALLYGFVKSRGWPKNGYRAAVAEFFLLTMASGTRGTRMAGIAAGLGWLALLGILLRIGTGKEL